jgi:hypothetical protein
MEQIQFFNNKKTQTARGTINSTSRVYHNLRKFKQNTLIKGTTNYNQRLWFKPFLEAFDFHLYMFKAVFCKTQWENYILWKL